MRRAIRIWDGVEQVLVGLLGLAALLVGAWQVFGRYFDTQASSSWGDEVMVYLIVWAVMIVSSQLVRRDGHVRPDIVLRLLPVGVQRVLEVANCLVGVLFCGALAWYGWQIVGTARMLDERSSSALAFPMWIYYLALPVGMALMALRYAIRLGQYVFAFDPATMTVGAAHAPASLDDAPAGH